MEDSSFKEVRRGLIILCLIIISLYILKIEIANSRLSIGFLGGAKINEPTRLFLIIYALLGYYVWKYAQYLYFKHDEGQLYEKFKVDYLTKYAYRYVPIAEKQLSKFPDVESINKFERFKLINGGKIFYTFKVVYDQRLMNRGIEINLPIYRFILNYIWNEPKFTYHFLPMLLLLGVLFILIFPEWEGGLNLYFYIKCLFTK